MDFPVHTGVHTETITTMITTTMTTPMWVVSNKILLITNKFTLKKHLMELIKVIAKIFGRRHYYLLKSKYQQVSRKLPKYRLNLSFNFLTLLFIRP